MPIKISTEDEDKHQLVGKKDQNQFVYTTHTLRLIEKVLMSVNTRENVLLVGETGTGKTTIVQ
jgi:midasin (ATPase involved in ribosome maturation)